MIKNLILKKVTHAFVFPVLSVINKYKHHESSCILLHTDLGLRDNVWALLEYLIKEKYYERYEIICSTNDYKIARKKIDKRVKIVGNVKGVIEYLKAGYVFYCFGRIPVLPGKNQVVVQMWHGTPLKDITKKSPEKYCSYVFSPSRHFVPIISRAFGVTTSKVLVCGHPRNDKFKSGMSYDLGNYSKLVLWVPTVRKSSYLNLNNGVSCHPLPIISKERFEYLNNELSKLGVLLFVKLHPMEDSVEYENVNFSNLIIMSHRYFEEKGFDLYVLAGQSDAMITDYSSIYFDYLLLNKPIGFTEDDIEEYKQNRGFAVSDLDMYRPGVKIRTEKELMDFLILLSEGVDNYRDERARVNLLANDSFNGSYCQKALSVVGIS
jgi:CDP-glycerol glycerophosphotransferase (TagB/SpsB family)